MSTDEWLFLLLFMFLTTHLLFAAVGPVLWPWPRTPPPVLGLWGTRWSQDLSFAVLTTPPHRTTAPAEHPGDQIDTCRASINYHQHLNRCLHVTFSEALCTIGWIIHRLLQWPHQMSINKFSKFVGLKQNKCSSHNLVQSFFFFFLHHLMMVYNPSS